MLVVPAARNASVVILIIVFIAAACIAVTFIFMFFVAFSVSVPVTLGSCKIAGEDEKSERAGEYPFCRFHFSLQFEATVFIRIAEIDALQFAAGTQVS